MGRGTTCTKGSSRTGPGPETTPCQTRKYYHRRLKDSLVPRTTPNYVLIPDAIASEGMATVMQAKFSRMLLRISGGAPRPHRDARLRRNYPIALFLLISREIYSSKSAAQIPESRNSADCHARFGTIHARDLSDESRDVRKSHAHSSRHKSQRSLDKQSSCRSNRRGNHKGPDKFLRRGEVHDAPCGRRQNPAA